MSVRNKNNTLPKRLAISAAVATTFLAGYGSRQAYAGTCTGAAGTYTCSGAANSGADTQQTLNSGANPLIVTTNTGFGINVSGAYSFAFNLLNSTPSTSINFLDANTSIISGGQFGIYSTNQGKGATSITTTGSVTGLTVTGIAANNYSSATDLTISAATVTGGYYGIFATNSGKGATSITSTGTVTGAKGAGIKVTNGTTATDLTINTAAVTGAKYGIWSRNQGSGSNSITTTGTITATNYDGIRAYNSTNSYNLTINTTDVTGGSSGIFAQNYGTGATTITSTGLVTGNSYHGIYARHNAGSDDLTISTVDVAGNQHGIYAINQGAGNTTITSTGSVTGTNRSGIYAGNGLNTYDLTISTANVTGGRYGIQAHNYGKGETSITSAGSVTGTSRDGIRAENYTTATNLTISAANVTGGANGIYAGNRGAGTTSITSTGTVTGTNRDGIRAEIGFYSDPPIAGDLTISAVTVTGGNNGIYARNFGQGAVNITSTGAVTGTNYSGIGVYNSYYATDLTIVSSAAVTGGDHGIDARNSGKGATSITSTGLVTGTNNGINVRTNNYTTSLTINSADVTGGYNGIYARNRGTGATSITITGAVTGGGGKGVGIYSYAYYNNSITLNSGASVSAASGIAIDMAGGGTNSVTVNSGASVTGSVDLGGAPNTMTLNGGTLNVANGFSLNVNGNVVNTNGVINLRSSALQNATITGNFTGGGQLLVNADFATNTADKLNITGNVLAGGTSVGVTDISTGPATGNAITLVSVGGTTAAGDFTLAAPVVNGAFNYNTLALVSHDWILQSVAAGGGSAVFTPFAGSFEAVSRSLLTLADLPSLSGRTQGRNGSSKIGASSGDTTGIDTPVWLRFAGGYRDVDSNRSSTGANFDTNHWLAQLGIDFTVADNANGRFVAGVNAGYNQANTDVKSTAGKSNIDTTGHSLGLSGTWYGVNGVYVDTQLQRSWYNTDLSAGGVGAGKVKGIDGDGYSAAIEVGKEIALNNTLNIIPQAQLTYAKVNSDQFTGANAEVVKFSNNHSLKARLGTALYKLFTPDGATRGFVTANVIREFEDQTQVNVSGAQLTNAVDRWTGELGVGLNHAWTSGANSYELSGSVSGSSSLNNVGHSTAAQGQVNFKVNF